MDQNNQAFQPDDPQPHSSRLDAPHPNVDNTFVDLSENRPLLSGGNHDESMVSIQSPENPASDFFEPNPRLNGG
jgi:hypothetical protein